jgi:hypothetical protein
MDVTPPPPATGAEIRRQVKQIVQDAKNAATDAKRAAQDAKDAAQNPDAGHTATTTVPAPAFNPSDIIPPQVVDISVAFFMTVAVCVVGFPLARAFGRRIDRKTEVKTVQGPDLTPQIRQLQDSVDAMAIELERISEGQRFTAKLLSERSSSPK